MSAPYPPQADAATAHLRPGGAPVPAIVVGCGLTALGAHRLLHRAGIPVYAVNSPASFEADSRWCRPLPGFGGDHDGRGLAAILAASPVAHAVLIPCSDQAVNEIAEFPPALAARFPASVPSAAIVAQLTDKAKFARLLDELAVPRPITAIVNHPSDVDAIPDVAFSGAFLKPRDSTTFLARYEVKAMRVDSRADAAAKLERICGDGLAVILQEFVPGPGSNHYLIDGFADSKARVRALFARRRIRIFPPDFGNSSYMVSVPIATVEPAVESLTKILSHLRYRGIFSAEFKFDERDGLFKILEINARAWAYVEYTGRCGIDVCKMAYDDALGLEVPEKWDYEVGARLIYPHIDFFAARREWQEHRLSLAGWLRSWIGAQQPHFNWSDPLPALRNWIVLARHIARRLLLDETRSR